MIFFSKKISFMITAILIAPGVASACVDLSGYYVIHLPIYGDAVKLTLEQTGCATLKEHWIVSNRMDTRRELTLDGKKREIWNDVARGESLEETVSLTTTGIHSVDDRMIGTELDTSTVDDYSLNAQGNLVIRTQVFNARGVGGPVIPMVYPRVSQP